MSSTNLAKLDALRHTRTKPVALFFDDGGVLNDNRVRGQEWLRLIGGFMGAQLGGVAEEWARANQVVFPRVWGNLQRRLPDFASHQAFQRAYATDWMRDMCAAVGVPSMPDDRAVTLYAELSVYVGERAMSAIPGAADVVLSLHRAGYALYTASGTTSWELQAILGHMGIAELFCRLYGPDLIDHVKYGPEFYQKLFADAGVAPSRSLVIESDQACSTWASEAGAHTVWIDPDGRGDAPTLDALIDALV